MITDTEKLQALIKNYDAVIENAKRELQALPESGYLRSYEHNGHYEYYLAKTKQDRKPAYISKAHQKIAIDLAQRDYDQKLIQACCKEKKELENALATLQKQWAGNSLMKTLHMPPHISPARSVLITPHDNSNQKFAQQWVSENYISNPYRPEDKIIVTDKGEYVRSKSEKIIADKLYALHLPYRYEAELHLPVTKQIRYPDFTVLRVADRTLIYIEHFGLLRDQKYRTTAFTKMAVYARNGIIPGKNAIFTYEDSENPFNSHHFEELVHALHLADQ